MNEYVLNGKKFVTYPSRHAAMVDLIRKGMAEKHPLTDALQAGHTSSEWRHHHCFYFESVIKPRYTGKYYSLAHVLPKSYVEKSNHIWTYCVRSHKKTGKATVTIHNVRECPVCNYR